ncbi:MAG: hypothetical protein JWR54_780 [Mucilaginibacter sp.]|nr:hypothetical protein [Mucilaginibacter sp.]
MKNLKLLLVILSLTFGFVAQLRAQSQSKGLYLTFNDYQHHKLSYGTDLKDLNMNKIFIHEFIGHNKVTVISNGKKLIFNKSEIFGYHNNNQDYRFYENKAYQIVDTTGFYIYSFEKLIQQGKGPKPERFFYFSTKTNNEILPLTSGNIENTFPKNPKFRNMVEVESKSGIQLSDYDKQLNTYKIKELYTESLK